MSNELLTSERLSTADTQHNTPAMIDTKRDRYPFCIVWGPLPLITWLIPFIGHMGIGDSTGRVHDFAGPYTIGIDSFMVPVAKYLAVSVSDSKEWDAAILRADNEYGDTVHNIVTNNCHHHTSRAFQLMQNMQSYTGIVKLTFLILLYGRYKSTGAIILIWLPFAIIVTAITLISIYAR